MSFARSQASHAGNGPFVPRMEALENRWCPSAASVKVLGHALIIQGDNGADQISITDDGSGNVAAKLVSGATQMTGTGSGITTILVDGKAGADTLDFKLTGQLKTNLDLHLRLGRGNDTANLDFGAGISGGHVHVKVSGGQGNDQVTASFGPISNADVALLETLGPGTDQSAVNFNGAITNSHVRVIVDGSRRTDTVSVALQAVNNSDVSFDIHLGKGNNLFNATLGGSINGHSSVQIQTHVGTGTDTAHVQATGVNIAAGADLGIHLWGGPGNDTASVDYSGKLNGHLNVEERGDPGNDTLTENLTVAPGSTGGLHAQELGGPGDDTLTLNVIDQTLTGKTRLAYLIADIDGGPGNKTIHSTSNVEIL